MTDAERTLLIAVAKALAWRGEIGMAPLRAVLNEQTERDRQAEDVARGRMIAAAMD